MDDNDFLNPYLAWLYHDLNIVSHSVRTSIRKIELLGQLRVDEFTLKQKKDFRLSSIKVLSRQRFSFIMVNVQYNVL